MKAVCRALGALLVGAFCVPPFAGGQNNGSSALKVTYGPGGIQTLAYNGTTLADLGAHPDDHFYIGHMKATDVSGKVLSGGQYGWGEVNSGKAWDPGSQTWKYTFTWGVISVHFAQNGASLDITTTVSNNGNSGIVFQGASVFPTVLRFPHLPQGFSQPNYPQVATNTTAPSVTTADWGEGEVSAVVTSAAKPLYSGFWPAQGGGGVPYAPEISGTSPDGLATFLPHNDRPVRPGQTDRYTVSLRFAPSGTPAASLAADAYHAWAATYPSALNWTDRRPIGTVYLASSPPGGGDASRPGGFPTNPRRYFNTDTVDVNTPAGLAAFQRRVLNQASTAATNARRMHAQGVVTWDIEGEQFPQATSYVCEPDAIAQISPEMESVVKVSGSPFAGQKLDDAYFGTLKKAGLKVGVCLRPQHFTLNSNGTAQQVYLPVQAIPAELLRKAKYAHDRWGATLFYVDSTVDPNGGVLPAAIFKQLQAALPDSLFIPEETTPLFYAYAAPFKSFIDLGAVGTEANALLAYPHAFSAVLVNDADAGKLAAAKSQLIAQVKRGDILMAHVDYWQDNDATIVEIYRAAHVEGPVASLKDVSAPARPASFAAGISAVTAFRPEDTVRSWAPPSLPEQGTFPATESTAGAMGASPLIP